MPTNMRGKKQATELKTVWAVAPLRSAPPAGEPPADKEHKYRHMPMRRCAGRWPAPCNAELTHRLKWYGYQLQLVETFTESPRYMFRRSSSCQRSTDTPSNSLPSTNEHADSSCARAAGPRTCPDALGPRTSPSDNARRTLSTLVNQTALTAYHSTSTFANMPRPLTSNNLRAT